jgi:hypothetical protein
MSGSISTPTIPVLSGWCRPSPGQGEFHHPPAYVLPPWWLSGALPPAFGYDDGSVALQDTGVLQAIPQLHRSERRRGAPFASCLPERERPLGRGLEGVPCVAIDPVNRLNHRCGCANTRSPGWSSGRLALTHHVWR